MKRMIPVFCSLFLVLAGVAQAGWEDEILSAMKAKVDPSSVMSTSVSVSSFELSDVGDNISLVMINPIIVPKGRDDTGKSFMKPAKVRFTVNGRDNLCEVNVVGNKTEACVFPNPAKKNNAPTVIYLWGFGVTKDGKPGYTLLNPNNPAIVYSTVNGDWETNVGDRANLLTLSVGIYAHPQKKSTWSKPLLGNKDKVEQGIFSESASR